MVSRIRRWLFAGLLSFSCATTPKPPEKTEAPPPVAPRLEKMREPLEVLPLELFFSGVHGVASSSESVTIRNTGDQSVAVSDLVIVGSQAATFNLQTDRPACLADLAATQSVGDGQRGLCAAR